MKPLITANTVRTAAESGQKRLLISAGSIVTPAAKDEAKQYGIALEYGAQTAAPEQNTASASAIDQNILQKIVQEVLRQLASEESAAVVDPSGLMHVQSGRREFAPEADEPRLQRKTILSKKESQIDAALMMLEAADISYAPQTAELVLIMEGSLSCTIDGRKYTAAPSDALVLPAGQKLRLLAKQKTIWFSIRLD